MDNEQAKEIRAALDALDDTYIQYPDDSTYEEGAARSRAEKKFVELVDDVRELLTENERLQALADAARALREHYPLVWNQPIDGDEFCPICMAFGYEQTDGKSFQHDKECPVERLADALAAYERAGERK